MLRSVELMRRSVRDAAAGKRARVRVGVTEDVAAWRLAKVLAAWRTQIPDLEIEIMEVAGRDTTLSLLEGDVDVCIATHALTEDVVECTELAREPIGVMLAETHALSAKRNIRLRELEGERLILAAKEGSGWAATVLPLLQARGFTVDRAQHAASAVGLVSAGKGIALSPLREAAAMQAACVVVRELMEVAQAVTLAAFFRKGEISSIVRKMIERHVARRAEDRRAYAAASRIFLLMIRIPASEADQRQLCADAKQRTRAVGRALRGTLSMRDQVQVHVELWAVCAAE